MSVYKEGYSIISSLNSQSRRIFPDACDYGVPFKKDDDVFNMIKQLVNSYGDINTRRHISYPTGSRTSIKVKLINEWAVSEGYLTIDQATHIFTINVIKHGKGMYVEVVDHLK